MGLSTLLHPLNTPIPLRALGLQSSWLWGLLSLLVLHGCSYRNKNILFKNEQYEAHYRTQRKANPQAAIIRLHPDSSSKLYEYHILQDDQISVRFVGLPKEMLDEIMRSSGVLNNQMNANATANVPGGTSNMGGILYNVDAQGYMTMPYLGRIYVKGKTILQLRQLLEDFFKQYNKEVLCDVRVLSMRVFVYTESAIGHVALLPRERTHLTEILANTHGLNFASKIKKVQIIRSQENFKNPQVIWIRLDKLDALAEDDLIVHANDLIYIEPRGVVYFFRESQTYLAALSALNFIATLYLLSRTL